MSQPLELEFPTGNGKLAGLHWSRPGAARMMCLHGWLDNANSFAALAPLLQNLDVVALDFAGHGHSAHRPEGTRYYFADYLWDLEYALDGLGWERCHLLGHSMGGAIASTFAAAAPDRVESLILLDGVGMLVAPASQTAKRLARSLESMRNKTGKMREFDSLEAAVRVRRGVSDFSDEAARLICSRSVEERNGHLRWRTDPRLNWVSPILMTEDQVLDILAHIQCPTLSLSASNLATWFEPGTIDNRHAAIGNCSKFIIEGHHHFHMDNPELVTARVLDFLATDGEME